MKIIPKEEFVINSPLSKQGVIEKFKENLKNTNHLGLTGIRQNSVLNYEGIITDDNIVFRRILKKGSNSFIPKVTVTISETGKGTSVNFSARLNKFVEILFLVFNLFIIGVLSIILVNNTIKLDLDFIKLIGQPIFMLLFANGLTRIFFSFEVYRLNSDFRKILISEEKEELKSNWLNKYIANSFLGK